MNLGLAINYEIDITLMDDMFSCDDSYWTPKTLDWYIWAGGNGYTEVAGSPLGKIVRQSLIFG
ncbi:hypothetical protein H1P_6150001 [Hyella patelloides LEGE 07179]|uniref:Uncharacterized protein n=1 Tax=Hyella patelloides LEGE 07179 TaxID=945734 RepID=A0A563W1H3_9CYAN|nr:hypothetical protein H1P_6150001 [Hyella patelloides LEGE 07179]